MTVPLLPPGSANPNSPEAIGALRRHPRFPDAMRHIGSRFLALHSDYFANQQVADEGRYLVCQFATILHAEYRPDDPESGLTLARLVRRCTEARVMPVSRIEAMVAVLRRSRRLIDAPSGTDRRVRRLEPGALLVAEAKQRIRFHLEALEMVVPGREWLRRLDDDPGFFWAVERERGIYFGNRSPLFDRLPGLALLSSIEGGYLTMLALIDAIDGPPEAPCVVAFPHAEMTERLRLPRAQLLRALKELAAAQQIEVLAPAGRAIRILPAPVETVATWHAIRLLRFDRSAARAAAVRDGAMPPPESSDEA